MARVGFFGKGIRLRNEVGIFFTGGGKDGDKFLDPVVSFGRGVILCILCTVKIYYGVDARHKLDYATKRKAWQGVKLGGWRDQCRKDRMGSRISGWIRKRTPTACAGSFLKGRIRRASVEKSLRKSTRSSLQA